ncbi:hypothetical protein BSKO_03931 [Bryopsis sp. KO-2023]|nr:hypothetical protein BSKO_03931 [Bryopsis sp. KO-2023]
MLRAGNVLRSFLLNSKGGERPARFSTKMANAELLNRVREEVEELHRSFVSWFAGEGCSDDDDTFERMFTSRLPKDALYIFPGGTVSRFGDFFGTLRAAYGSSPAFRIAIRDVQIALREGNMVVTTYVEWQKGSKNSTPAENGRRTSVVMEVCDDGIKWRHLHETWLPLEQMAKGPFDEF